MVESKHQWKAWLYLLPTVILLLIFTVWPIINTVTTAFIYKVEYKPATIQVETVGENEYRFFHVNDVGEKKYLGAKTLDGKIQLQYVESPDSADCTFKYNDDLTAWVLTVGEKQYFVGATDETDADFFEVNEENLDKLGVSIYPASLFADTPSNEMVSDFETDKGYNLGIFKGVPQAIRYVLGFSDEGYLDTSKSYESARRFYVSGNKNGYKFYLDEDDDYVPECYISVVVDEAGQASIGYNEDDGTAFVYDDLSKIWTCTVDDTQYYLGLDGINHVNVYPVAEIEADNAPTPVSLYRQLTEGGEAVEITPEGQNKIYVDEDAYCIGTHRIANGTQTYVTSGSSTESGLILTEDFINGESYTKFGINNFTYVLTSKGSDFMVCLKNTFILTIITVPISTILALLIAVALNSIKPLQRLLQTIFFLPYVTNSIAIGMVFAAMFNIVGINSTSESVGIINNILGVFGVERINWINYGAEAWASFTALIIYIVWNALPFKILILLGGLQSINKQYYDAAKIDSTPKWRVLTRITVPLLSPMLTYVIITSFIGGFKEYSSVVGIFGEAKAVAGGANMNTIVGHIQNHLTQTRDYGLAGAAALMLFVIIFIVTMINLRISKKNTHY